jgi:imidazolonepropionase-like amidohydrolase
MPPGGPSAASVALTGVNVVDVRTGRIVPRQTVVIALGRIVAVHDASRPAAAGSSLALDGKYVLPGLWDMHVHVTDAAYLDRFVAYGVTGVRDMGGGLDSPADGCESIRPEVLQRWRREIATGNRIGPQMMISGPVVSGSGWPTSLPGKTPEQARAAVRRLARLQVDFIKVYEHIPRSTYRVLALEAKSAGLPFAGHVPADVGPLMAVRSGQRSIEHIRDPLLVCFSADPRALEQFFTLDGWSAKDRRWGRSALAECPRIFAALRGSPTWLTPTLTVEKAKVAVENAEHVGDARRQLLPAPVRDGYAQYVRRQLSQSPAERASQHRWWNAQRAFVRRAHQQGARLLAGTDSACEGGLPGASLHGELAELVAAGISPAAAIRSATLEPARYFGRNDEGVVEAGRRADLVILDANPLSDIRNTRRIHAVTLNGRYLDRQQLRRLSGE